MKHDAGLTSRITLALCKDKLALGQDVDHIAEKHHKMHYPCWNDNRGAAANIHCILQLPHYFSLYGIWAAICSQPDIHVKFQFFFNKSIIWFLSLTYSIQYLHGFLDLHHQLGNDKEILFNFHNDVMCQLLRLHTCVGTVGMLQTMSNLRYLRHTYYEGSEIVSSCFGIICHPGSVREKLAHGRAARANRVLQHH